MTKRACPFDYDLSPQLKVHVGQKEVDNGVLRESRMKNVYDKTMDLLMKGAKELSHKLNTSTDLNGVSGFDEQPAPSKAKVDAKSKTLKQMVLNSNLKLETKDAGDVKTVPLGWCGCCRVIDQSEASRCSYCEKILCSDCLVKCAECSEAFCSDCSIVVYDSEFECNMCLNCYR